MKSRCTVKLKRGHLCREPGDDDIDSIILIHSLNNEIGQHSDDGGNQEVRYDCERTNSPVMKDEIPVNEEIDVDGDDSRDDHVDHDAGGRLEHDGKYDEIEKAGKCREDMAKRSSRK